MAKKKIGDEVTFVSFETERPATIVVITDDNRACLEWKENGQKHTTGLIQYNTGVAVYWK